MINLLKQKIEETIILKRDMNEQQIGKEISVQLYYYLMEKPGFKEVNITRALREVLKFDYKTRERVANTLCKEYLRYISKFNSLQNRDDIYLKSEIANPRKEIDDIIREIMENPRMIQRICEVNVYKIVKEIEDKRKLESSYFAEVANRSVNTKPAMDTLVKAKNVCNELGKYSDYSYAEEVFGYSNLIFDNENGNPIEEELKFGAGAKRKNAIYEVGGMSGILNIGQKNDGQYKPTQEDSILLYEHPKNKKFKIAVVADGMGGMRKWR